MFKKHIIFLFFATLIVFAIFFAKNNNKRIVIQEHTPDFPKTKLNTIDSVFTINPKN